MRKQFQPSVRVPGGSVGKDKDGKPVRIPPMPTHKQPHFINAAKRRRYDAGEISLAEATRPVFIFTGAASDVVKSQVNSHKYEQKKMMRKVLADMKEKAATADIKDVTDAEV